MKYEPPANLEPTMIAVWAERTFESVNKSTVTPGPKLPPSLQPFMGKELTMAGALPGVRLWALVCVWEAPLLDGTIAEGRQTGILSLPGELLTCLSLSFLTCKRR